VSNKKVTDLFEEVQKAELKFENQELFDLGILKTDENDEVTFDELYLGVLAFGCSYLLANCREMKVVDLLIEMAADNKEYKLLYDRTKWDFIKCIRAIIKYIFKDQACEKIYGKRLTENEETFQRFYRKDTENKRRIVTRLIFTATKYGDEKVVKKMMQETNQKQETCLHRIARNSENLLEDFLETVKKKNLVDDFEEWLSKTDSEGKTFLFYLSFTSDFQSVFNFFEKAKINEIFIGKLLLEKDNQGVTFLFSQRSEHWDRSETLRAIARITSQHILREILISRNNENENILLKLNNFCEFIEILGIIKETFPNYLKLFKSLFDVTNNQGVHFMEKIKTKLSVNNTKQLFERVSKKITEDELKEIFGDDFKIIFDESE
jgi:hypothetical protein